MLADDRVSGTDADRHEDISRNGGSGFGGCMSSEHFGQSAWQFKRMSGSSRLKVQAAIGC